MSDRVMYYDRQGNSMTEYDWARSCALDDRLVARTFLPDGTFVSTVWLGLDHALTGPGPPLIFETMVFPKNSRGENENKDVARYSTEEEAKAGHEAMVRKWTLP